MSENPLLEDPVLMRRLAKYVVQQCFRNTALEEYHAGTVPDSAIGDYSDVVVRSPFGEVPWRELSRISDEEMKALMKDAITKTYRLLLTLFDEQRGAELIRLGTRERATSGRPKGG